MNTLMANPLLMVAAVLLILGPLVFLISLIQFIRSGKKHEPLDLLEPESEPIEEEPEQPHAKLPADPLPPTHPPYMKQVEEPPPPNPTRKDPEKTMALMPGFGEVQGQLEIAFTQIKTLSRKVNQLESELESVARTSTTHLEKSELSAAPTDPADYMQKLLKFAEHVIVLEKEVANLKAGNSGTQTPSNGDTSQESDEAKVSSVQSSIAKPPIMPI